MISPFKCLTGADRYSPAAAHGKVVNKHRLNPYVLMTRE